MFDIFNTWPWYISGPLIGLFVPLLILVGNKMFGISSSFEHICDMTLPKSKKEVMNYNKSKNGWKFYFVIGIVIGAFIASNYLTSKPVLFLPNEYWSFPGMIKLFIGGLFVGFGTRYANGCTSGHAITGISMLNWGSIRSTIAFFIGGMVLTFITVYFF